jgi:Domain of unknown function (DUF5664)/Domain of unknown function (DUF4406)
MNTDTSNPKDLVGVTKPQLNLVPSSLIIHVAKAMENGAAKYGPYNWRDKKVRTTIYIAAAQRHLLSLLDGEDFAQDSGIHHAAHAAACMGIILDALECGCLINDRPTKGNAAPLIERLTAKKPENLKVENYTREAGHDDPYNGWPFEWAVHNKKKVKKKIYIAGPMRGIKEFNFPAFYAAEEKLRALGYETFNPARRDEEKYGSGVRNSAKGLLSDIASTGLNLREALGADTAWISKEADAIYMLPGWEYSKGARAENALANALGLEVILWKDLDSKP